jgi:hypothetical protein
VKPTVEALEDRSVPAQLTFSAASETVDASAGTFSITVALSGTNDRGVSVPFTLGGTAQSGTDYAALTASPLVIPAGQTSATITGALLFNPGASRTLTFSLGTPVNADLGITTTNTLTITESSTPSPIHIQFDYSLDTSNFFANNPQAKVTLQQAADALASQITNNLTAIVPDASNSWTATINNPTQFINPQTGTIPTLSLPNLTIPANTLVVFVGGGIVPAGASEDGVGGPGGFSSSNTSLAFYNNILARGQAGALSSPPTAFSPYGGSITFADNVNWYFGTDPNSPQGQIDFYTAATHELGHVLGIGTAPTWNAHVSNGTFTGPHAEASYGGPVPLDQTEGAASNSHWAQTDLSAGQQPVMTPIVPPGTQGFTPLDFAGLQDIGWIPPGVLGSGPAPTLTPTNATITNVSSTNVVAGQPVTFTITVSAGSGTPTGLVQLLNGGLPIQTGGTGNLVNGSVTISLSTGPGGALPVGTAMISAQYAGDGSTFQLSAPSPAMSIIVNPNPTGGGGPSARPSGIGAFDSASGQWYLRNERNAGAPDAGQFAYGLPNWGGVVGDWDGNGTTTVGVVNPTGLVSLGGTAFPTPDAYWYLRNENSAGGPDVTGQPFAFGLSNWIPIAGDWTGSGHTGIGMFDPTSNTFYLENDPGSGKVDFQFQYGAPGWIPVAGDWNHSGHTGIGLVDPATMTWYLRNEVGAGAPDAAPPFVYGAVGWKPVVGDWDGNGSATVGVFDPSAATWYLRNENSTGAPDAATPFAYGFATWKPVAGVWTLPAATQATPASAAGSEDLLAAMLAVDPGGVRRTHALDAIFSGEA